MSKIEWVHQNWVRQIARRIHQQGHALSMLGIHRKIERPLLFYPSGAERQRSSFYLCPCGELWSCNCHLQRVSGIVSKYVIGYTVHVAARKNVLPCGLVGRALALAFG